MPYLLHNAQKPEIAQILRKFYVLSFLAPLPGPSSAPDEPQMKRRKVGLKPTKWYSQHERENPRTLRRRTPSSLTRAHTPQPHTVEEEWRIRTDRIRTD